jgi:hypothetical protein
MMEGWDFEDYQSEKDVDNWIRDLKRQREAERQAKQSGKAKPDNKGKTKA